MVVIEPGINIIDTVEGTLPSTQEALPEYGILLTPPGEEESAPEREGNNDGVSFIFGGLFVLALVIALRFRANVKQMMAMVHDLMSTRVRQNAFDDTVRETSLLVLLNILWCASAGILCYCVYASGDGVPIGNQADGMLGGMGMATIYSVFLYLAYATVGWVFSDGGHAALWIKGYAASQALMAPAFFLLALLAFCSPAMGVIEILAIIVFISAKLAFILKGYKIFFNQFSSWVLFLCYLCSLEIVPLILCYRCAHLLG